MLKFEVHRLPVDLMIIDQIGLLLIPPHTRCQNLGGSWKVIA
jgi:hypothetical protein